MHTNSFLVVNVKYLIKQKNLSIYINNMYKEITSGFFTNFNYAPRITAKCSRVCEVTNYYIQIKKLASRVSLVAQWLRISQPIQGTQVQALVREDPTCHGAAKPVHYNY